MLRPVSTSSASASSAPLAVQAGAATTPPSQETPAASAGAVEAPHIQATAASAAQTFRYNSFEFVYRQDIGRIVLVGQSPETGERVIQVPSEKALQAYERTARVERQMDRIQSNRETAQQSQGAVHLSAPQPAPQLAKALVAAVSGANHGSGVVSVSA